MRHAQTNAELAAFHAEGTGLVFNDFTTGRSAAGYNVLHVASCPWFQRMLDRADPQARPSVRKLLFSAADEAQAWLTSNRGQEGYGWKYCATCGANRVQTREHPHPGARTDPAGTDEEDRADAWVPGALLAPDSWPADALPFAMPASQPAATAAGAAEARELEQGRRSGPGQAHRVP
jgi:hypothetical protein